MNFDTIKKNFDHGIWSAAMVKTAVRKGIITKDEYTTITGKAYEAAAGTAPTAKEDVDSLKAQVASLTEQNAMLEECIVEMAQVVYA